MTGHARNSAPRVLLLVTLPLLLAGSALPAAAESLSDAWSMALQSDGTVAAARGEQEAADAEQTAAHRQRWPALDMNGAYTQFEHAPGLDIATTAGPLQAPLWRHDGYGAAAADLSVPIWTSGRISGSIGAASAAARAAGSIAARTAADVKLAVAESYIAVFRARHSLAVAESNVASLKAHSDDVHILSDKQAVAQSDVLAAEVALANAEQQRLRAANGVRLTNAAYNRWVGQPLDRIPDLDEPATVPPPESAEPLESLLTQALQQRPELTALAAQQEQLEQAARAERAQGLPQIILHAEYNHLDNAILDRENFASVGIGFQWRLFDSGQLAARTSALQSRARAAGRRLDDLRSVIRLDVETAYYNREEALARIHAASTAVAQAEENLRTSRELYSNGLGTNNQVLDAESSRIIAMSNQDDAMFDVLVAGFRLRRATGSL